MNSLKNLTYTVLIFATQDASNWQKHAKTRNNRLFAQLILAGSVSTICTTWQPLAEHGLSNTPGNRQKSGTSTFTLQATNGYRKSKSLVGRLAFTATPRMCGTSTPQMKSWKRTKFKAWAVSKAPIQVSRSKHSKTRRTSEVTGFVYEVTKPLDLLFDSPSATLLRNTKSMANVTTGMLPHA